MTKASDNAFPSILITEGTEPSAPAAGKQRIYIDSTTHLLKATNSSGTDRTIEGVTAGAITSSGLTQATARLLGRTTASTGAIEEITVGSGLSLSAGSLTATGGSGGGLVWLQTQTASASATLDFTSFISGTYDEYRFEFINLLNTTNAQDFWVRVGTGGGPTYQTTDYSYQDLVWRAAATATAGNTAQAKIVANFVGATVSNASGPIALNGHMTLYDPGSTTWWKVVEGRVNYYDGSFRVVNEFSGMYEQTTALTAVRFMFASGNITSGIIRCYGLSKT